MDFRKVWLMIFIVTLLSFVFHSVFCALLEGTWTRADKTKISQLLWAARGRTPHYVKSHPWGLTIPTWGGVQYAPSSKKLGYII